MDIMDIFESIINEVSVSGIDRKQKSVHKLFPTFSKRVQAVADHGGVRLTKMRPDYWQWKVHSGTKKSTWYDCDLQFVDLNVLIANLVANKKLWTIDRKHIDLRKLAKAILFDADLKIKCSCPADLYWGKQYIRSKDKYSAEFGEPETRRPKIRNPHEFGFQCFDDRALVLMSDGTYKNINKVQIGDFVITHTGSIKRVTDLFVHKTNELYEVKIQGFSFPFGVTGDHEFYVKDPNRLCLCGCNGVLQMNSVWKQNGLTAVFERKYLSGHYKRGQKTEDKSNTLQWLPFESLDKATLLYIPIPTFGDIIHVDDDYARLMGYYLAEGSISYREKALINPIHYFLNKNNKKVVACGVTFTLNLNEKDTLAADIKDCFKKSFGETLSLSESNKSNTCWLSSSTDRSKELYKDFIFNVGVGCKTKKINEQVLKWNTSAKINFLAGVLLGDGHIQSGSIGLRLANETVIQQIHTLLTSLGIKATMTKGVAKCQTGIVGMWFGLDFITRELPKDLIDILKKYKKLKKVTKKKITSHLYRYGNGGMFARFSSIEKQYVKKKVYNIEVEDDHSYIVNGIAVHNCKHLQALRNVLPFYISDMAKWLKEQFSSQIKYLEKDTLRTGKQFKAAAAELVRRKGEEDKKHQANTQTEPEMVKSKTAKVDKTPAKSSSSPKSVEPTETEPITKEEEFDKAEEITPTGRKEKTPYVKKSISKEELDKELSEEPEIEEPEEEIEEPKKPSDRLNRKAKFLKKKEEKEPVVGSGVETEVETEDNFRDKLNRGEYEDETYESKK